MLGLILIGFACSNSLEENSENKFSRNDFPDVLDVLNTPVKPVDWNSFCFSDKGAWFGFALPDTSNKKIEASFAGPFLMTNGRWLSKSIATLKFYNEDLKEIQHKSYKSTLVLFIVMCNDSNTV